MKKHSLISCILSTFKVFFTVRPIQILTAIIAFGIYKRVKLGETFSEVMSDAGLTVFLAFVVIALGGGLFAYNHQEEIIERQGGENDA